MRHAILLISALLLFCVAAQAQDTPAWEFGGNYSYFIGNVNKTSFDLNGGGGSVGQNLNNWFGGRLEINAFGGTSGGENITAASYTYGPVFALRKWQRFTPYAHVQLGAMTISAGYLGVSRSETKFVLVPGGGVDIGLNPYLAVRVQADYVSTYYLNSQQSNVQLSAGLVYRFGHK